MKLKYLIILFIFSCFYLQSSDENEFNNKLLKQFPRMYKAVIIRLNNPDGFFWIRTADIFLSGDVIFSRLEPYEENPLNIGQTEDQIIRIIGHISSTNRFPVYFGYNTEFTNPRGGPADVSARSPNLSDDQG